MAAEVRHSCLAELNVPGRHLNWSKEIFAAKFNASYKTISEADHVKVGAVELFPEYYGGRRWLHWEATAGRICLREVWLDQDLLDHSLCLQLGGSHLGAPASVHLECISSHDGEESFSVRACFVMSDGSVHNLLLEANSKDQSFLAGIVDVKEGCLVESVDSDFELATKHSLICTHQLSDSSLNGQSITSASFLSHFAIVFGLSDGDVVYLRMASRGASVFVETVMRYTGVVQSLWSGIMGSTPGSIKPKVVVISGSHLRDSSIAVTYTADGCLSVWDCLSRNCLQKVTVLELVGIAGAGQGGVYVESVKLDTCPIDTGDSCCLGIVLAVTSRAGRERHWSNLVLSWSPNSPRALVPRGRLLPPQFNTSSLQSTNVSLEQISLSPCGTGSRSGHDDTIASLWKVGTEVIPVAHFLTTGQFRWTPPVRGSDTVHDFRAHLVTLGPAEKHAHWKQGDQVFDRAVVSSLSRGVKDTAESQIYRWSAVGETIQPPPGTGLNVEIDMHYLRTSFLQRLFSPGRFPFHVIVRVITQDVPIEVQQLCADEEDGGYEGLMDLLLARGMDTTVEEKDDSTFGFIKGNLGGGSHANVFSNAKVESPLETLVKAVIGVCGKYEDLVLDRLVQEEAHVDSGLNIQLQRYRCRSLDLSLRAQMEVCRDILQLCEDRLCQLRSGSNSCSLLVHTRGGTGGGKKPLGVVETPFEFVVVRPIGLGVVVSTSLVVESNKTLIPDYAEDHSHGVNDISSFVPFSLSSSPSTLTDKGNLIRLMGIEMASQPKAFALLDTLLSRFVTDVSFFNMKQSQFHRTDAGIKDDLDDDSMDGTPDDAPSPSLSDTAQYLFSQAVALSEECLSDMFACFENAVSIPWGQGNEGDIFRAVFALFDDLLIMPSLPSNTNEHGMATYSNPMRSIAGAELLYDLSAVTTRSACVYYQAISCLFSGLLQSCSKNPAFALVCKHLREKYLPIALNNVVHYSFIRWTESVHMSSSRQLQKVVDFRDLTYNSAIIDSLRSDLGGQSPLPTSPFDSSNVGSCNNTSVLLSFWHQFSAQLTFVASSRGKTNSFWSSLSERCLVALRPSTHSEYTSYLFDVGQYCLATKSASLAVMSDVEPQVSLDSNLLQYFYDTHSLAMQRIAGVQMYLNDVTAALRGSAPPNHRSQSHSNPDEVALDASNMEEIKNAVNLLIKLVDVPSSFSDQFSVIDNEWSCRESRITYGAGRSLYSLQDKLFSASEIEDSVRAWARSCLERQGKQWPEDELLCLCEALLKLAATPYFRVFYSTINLMMLEEQQQWSNACRTDVISIMLQCYPDLVMQLHFVSLAVNCHNLVNRSRTLLPLDFGVDLALMSGHTAVGVLEHVIQNFTVMFNAWNLPQADGDASYRLVDAGLHYIRKELEIVLSSLYSNILEVSLISCRLDEGYAAVSDLVLLHFQSAARDQFWADKNAATIASTLAAGGEDGNNMDSDDDELAISTMTLQWHGSLRSLIVKACSCGQLQWVCDRNDVERFRVLSLDYEHGVEFVGEQVVDTVKEIVNQLEFVCNSSDFTDYFSGNSVGVGGGSGDNNSLHLLALYDCLAAFLLSKGLRQECSRVMYQLVLRLDDELFREAESDEDFDPLRILDPQLRALGTAIGALHHDDLALSERYIVLRNAQSAREGDGGAGDNALLHVTLADMLHMYLQVQSKVSLVKSVALSGASVSSLHLDDGEIVRCLCSQGNFYDAINLGISSANQFTKECPQGTSSTGRSPSLEQAISLLATACASPASPPSFDTIAQFASALGTNLTSFLEYEETADSPKFLREYLVHCLQCLDGPTGNWSLHAAATEAMLKSSSFEALGTALTDSYCGFATSDVSDFVYVPDASGLSGNISAFLMQLLRKGYLTQACDTATRLVSRTEPQSNHHECCLPYMVLDRVLDASSRVLASHSHGHTGPVEALSRSHAALEAALNGYFGRLLVVEAGGSH